MPDSGGERALLSKAEYGRHRGVSGAQVTHWRKADRLEMVGDRVDRDASDARLAKTLDPTTGGKHPAVAAPASSGVAPDGEAGPDSSLADVKRRRELVKLGADLGKLVDRAAFERTTETAFVAARERLSNIGPALGSRLAAENDPRRCVELVTAEIDGALNELADALDQQRRR